MRPGRLQARSANARWLAPLAALLVLGAPALAQEPRKLTLALEPPAEVVAPAAVKAGPPVAPAAARPLIDPQLTPAQCSSCGSGGGGALGLRAPDLPPGLGSDHPRLFDCDCGKYRQPCYPGRECCHPCLPEHDTAFGRFLCGLYDCLCCPDPCYEPKWRPIADTAFFTEAARPITQTRIRWESGVNLILPDRSEYFWARADGSGRGPKATGSRLVVPELHYNDLSYYQEIGSGMGSFIIETPYRSMDPDYAPHAANFGDMNIATKAMLFDCELLQVSFIFRTYLPVGSAGKGLGTGHVSLEPSLVFGIKLLPDTYLQGQLSEWIPLGGDPSYAGAILHYHFSVNQVLCRLLPDVPLIGTVEMMGFHFQEGQYTDPVLGAYQKSGDNGYFYMGAGLRLFVCDRIDFGAGMMLALTHEHFASEIYRTEFRFRY